MLLEEYSVILSAFREAFGDEAKRPGWSDVKWLHLEPMLKAIRQVRANPRLKFYNQSLIAGMVITRCRAIHPPCQRCGTYAGVQERNGHHHCKRCRR